MHWSEGALLMADDRHDDRLEEEAAVLAALATTKLWQRYMGEALDKYIELERQGFSASRIVQELEQFLVGLSEKPVADIARKTSAVSYNTGRNAEIVAAALEEKVEWVVRSEVLDSATCGPCAGLDNSMFRVGTNDFYEFAPPAKCLGGGRCRGFYIAIGGA